MQKKCITRWLLLKRNECEHRKTHGENTENHSAALLSATRAHLFSPSAFADTKSFRAASSGAPLVCVGRADAEKGREKIHEVKRRESAASGKYHEPLPRHTQETSLRVSRRDG